MRYAVINKATNKVENIIEAEMDFNLETDEYALVIDTNREASIGMSYIDKVFKTEWEMKTFDEQKAYTRKKLDEIVETKIASGFVCSVGGNVYKFSYTHFDQQNFADIANACILAKMGMEELPIHFEWKAYDINAGNKLNVLTLIPEAFLKVYTEALKHKMTHMAEATKLKLSVDKMVTTYELTTLLNQE